MLVNLLLTGAYQQDILMIWQRLITSIVLILISAILTGLGLYSKMGRFCGAGTVVPITGFANSVVSPAIEFKKEGFIFGLGSKDFYCCRSGYSIWNIDFSFGWISLLFYNVGDMVNKKLGVQTIKFDNKPVIISASSTVGEKRRRRSPWKLF